jgi:alpha-L-rhamnosidase
MHWLRTNLFALALVTLVRAAPVDLRCNYLVNPIGIDSSKPHLSWRNDSGERNWRQAAFRILVATSLELLESGKPDVWDSGRVASADSVGIPFGGKPLESGRRYYWTVQVWDHRDRVTRAAPAWWEMGLLEPSDWKAKWIARQDLEEEQDRNSIRWVWIPGQDPFSSSAAGPAEFRVAFQVKQPVRNAALYLLARSPFKATVNGHFAGAKDGRFRAFDRQDITEFLQLGTNAVVVSLAPRPASRGPQQRGPQAAGLAGLVKLVYADGTVERFPTGTSWECRATGGAPWLAVAVVAPLSDPRMGPDPGPLPAAASLFRREFSVARPVRAARLYITALGSYRAFLNGRRVGSDVLTPEYTEYAKRVTAQTYDVTDLLTTGRNAIGVILGDGWFGSALSWIGIRFSFLPPPTRLLAQLRIDYGDGARELVVTDESWKTAPAPILHSEIYAGEVYDARLDQPGWHRAGFEDSRWSAPQIAEAPPARISGLVTVPPRIVESLRPREIRRLPDGAQIVDMGQNMVGWVKLRVSGRAGTKIRLRFAEILNPDGTLYVDNLRNANQTDAFYLRGEGQEVFEPHFTFHGFRYVEVRGYPEELTPEKLSGEVISSAHTITGRLQTSSELVNQMWRNGIWGQRGNFLSVPTDCPQRDERLGWTGDAQIFWRTGAYNADIAAFGRKWLRDVVDGQTAQGAFGNTAPALPGGGFGGVGAPGWGDAGVIVPWTAWQQYGDTGIIEENWEAMSRWMKFIEDANPNYLRRNRTGANFADWLPAGSQTPRDLVATAYWAMIARMMAEMAEATGKPEEAVRYQNLYRSIRDAFQKEFIKPDGSIGSGSQTSYVLALQAGLVPEDLRAVAFERLIKDLEAHDWHLTTGFLGTPHLLFVLSDHGRDDVAYRLLLNETYPSWGYMIRKGATTWWERWNSDTGDPAMNSFNHYAFGSVMAWVYRYAAGIETDGPGFRKIIIRPRLDEHITHVRGEYDSVQGKIVSEWSGTAKGPFRLGVTIPANTTATVYLPAIPGAQLTEGGRPLKALLQGGHYVVQIGSGRYEFLVK